MDNKRIKKNEWNFRLNLLKSEIEKWLKPDTVLEHNINIINLFYDNFECNFLLNINKTVKSKNNSIKSKNNLIFTPIQKSNIINIDNSYDDLNIYYFSELSSDSDNQNINIYKKYDINTDLKLYYFSDLSSDDENINTTKPSVL